jgi:hypothetical protein
MNTLCSSFLLSSSPEGFGRFPVTLCGSGRKDIGVISPGPALICVKLMPVTLFNRDSWGM